MKRMKKISIGILFLLMIGMIAAIYQASGYSRNYSRYYLSWDYHPLPNGEKAIDIAIGHQGGFNKKSGVFCIGDDGGVYQFNSDNEKWDSVSTRYRFVRISVNHEGRLYAIRNDNAILYQYGSGWRSISKKGLPTGNLKDIGVGFHTNQLYVVGSNNYAYWFTTAGEWKKIGGAPVTRVAVDGGHGTPLAINGYTHWTYQGFGGMDWGEIEPRGYAWNDVAGEDTCPYICGWFRSSRFGSSVYRYNPMWGSWERITSVYGARGHILANNIDVGGNYLSDQNQQVWITNAKGEVYNKTIPEPS